MMCVTNAYVVCVCDSITVAVVCIDMFTVDVEVIHYCCVINC